MADTIGLCELKIVGLCISHIFFFFTIPKIVAADYIDDGDIEYNDVCELHSQQSCVYNTYTNCIGHNPLFPTFAAFTILLGENIPNHNIDAWPTEVGWDPLRCQQFKLNLFFLSMINEGKASC